MDRSFPGRVRLSLESVLSRAAGANTNNQAILKGRGQDARNVPWIHIQKVSRFFGGEWTLRKGLRKLIRKTFLEYAIHRKLFHCWSDTGLLFSAGHEEHHRQPQDRTSVGSSLPAATSVHLVMTGVLGLFFGSLGIVSASGVTIGYALYEWVHAQIHGPHRLAILGNLRQHHFSDRLSNFGVTSPLWDIVWRTRIRDPKANV